MVREGIGKDKNWYLRNKAGSDWYWEEDQTPVIRKRQGSTRCPDIDQKHWNSLSPEAKEAYILDYENRRLGRVKEQEKYKERQAIERSIRAAEGSADVDNAPVAPAKVRKARK